MYYVTVMCNIIGFLCFVLFHLGLALVRMFRKAILNKIFTKLFTFHIIIIQFVQYMGGTGRDVKRPTKWDPTLFTLGLLDKSYYVI